ncbi:tolloid-like protein 2 [Oculina patagonica]
MLLVFFLCGFCLLFKALKTEATMGTCETPGANRIVHLTKETGKLEMLNSSSSSKQVKCITWIITVAEGHLVKLKIITFWYRPACTNSTLQIRDGRNSSGDAYESLCGLGRNIATLFSSGRHLWVQLMQSLNDNEAEIYAVFKAVKQSAVGLCRGPQANVIALTNQTGSFFSPLFPSDFPAGTQCTWVITVPEGHFVKLSIKSFLLDRSCSYSFLRIWDGQNSTSDLLNTFCGEEFEASVFSSGRHLRVHLDSSFTNYHAPGFYAVYETVKQVPAPFACTAALHSITLKSQSGTLASYNYPLPYDDAIECTWRFDVDSDYKIELSFDVFNLSFSLECSVDYLEIDQARYCGSEKPAPITLDSSDMRIKFKSSGKTKYPGFKASYETKRTTTAILKIVGICVGVTLIALCVVSKFCYRCCKSGHQTELGFGQIRNVDTETEEINSQEQNTMV